MLKLIEGMKALKRLTQKVHDLAEKIKANCALLEDEKPPYPDQTGTVAGWRQSAVDTLAEIARLRMAITRTNLATAVPIDFGGTIVTKPIAYWVARRRELCGLETTIYRALSDRGLKPRAYQKDGTGEIGVYQIVRFFDPAARDKRLEILRDEPGLIDAALEMANAMTDLIFDD